MTQRTDTDTTGTHRRHARRVLSTLVAAALLAGASPAPAAFTTENCLAGKLQAWGKLRQCQRNERAKSVRGRASDVVKCQTKLQETLAKLDGKAVKVGIKCRYLDNTDSTITDLGTGLMWEKKTTFNVNVTAIWVDAMTVLAGLNCSSADGATLEPCSLYGDWRLPNIVELGSIVDLTAPGCGSGQPCIDPIFGPTVAGGYWSATTTATNPDKAWYVDFGNGVNGLVANANKVNDGYVRAVRGAL